MRIGAVGTGSIVRSMLQNMEKVEGIACEAICSRKEETGRKLADEFGISKVYTDLDAMCQDPDLDFIYIASPNSLHYPQAKKALSCGKHVICEKPFTPTVKEAEELIRMAKERHLFLLEGITTIRQPNYHWVQERLDRIGDLKMATCTFCQYSSRYDAFQAGQVPNVFNPAFAGGSLMDINLYNIYFLVGLFGTPDQVAYYPGCLEGGIDTHGILILRFGSLICQCTGAKDTWCENNVQLLGDKGYLRITPCSSNCKDAVLVARGAEPEQSPHQDEDPWFYEIQELVKLVQDEDYETCYRNLELTVKVVDVLEKARKSAGIVFP